MGRLRNWIIALKAKPLEQACKKREVLPPVVQKLGGSCDDIGMPHLGLVGTVALDHLLFELYSPHQCVLCLVLRLPIFLGK